MREIFHPNQTGTARWLSLAKRDGFVLAAPNGTHSITGAAAGDNQRWNDLRSDGGARDSKADDVSFILSMIDDLVKTNDINPRRVYVTGASNGGRMTFRLLVEQPLRFAAGASFIANLPAGEVALPKVGTPIFICNGTEDPLVPDAGGRGEARSTEATVQYWVKANGGSVSTKSSRELPDADPRDGSRIREWSYGGSAGSMPVLYARVEGGGHYMPSSSAGENRPIVKKRFGHHQNRDADGADLAWDFMRVFQR
jgi:polyhydroxybutyrate depolymerase